MYQWILLKRNMNSFSKIKYFHNTLQKSTFSPGSCQWCLLSQFALLLLHSLMESKYFHQNRKMIPLLHLRSALFHSFAMKKYAGVFHTRFWRRKMKMKMNDKHQNISKHKIIIWHDKKIEMWKKGNKEMKEIDERKPYSFVIENQRNNPNTMMKHIT